MMKTYGRPSWRVYDEDQRPAAKKRRVQSDSESDAAEKSLEYAIRESTANMRSSPSRRNSIALSDGSQDTDLSTPPSSPPPRLSPPPQNTRKPTFSFLKRKHSATKDSVNGSPLSEVNSNSVRASLDPPKKKTAASSTQQPALKQMQLDLGHEVRKTCGTCGMEYVPSNAEDASLHKKYHDMNSTGVDLGKAFMRANASRWVYEATRFDEGYVVIIDRKASPTARNQAKKVLEVICKELSSPVIEDDILWSQIEPPKHLRKNGDSEKLERYKVFLHMKDSRCVGACLTERIWHSHPVDKGTAQLDGIDPAVTVRDENHPAIVGISRIWTSGSSRRKGIAMDLLDCVVSNFFYGMEIPKEQVAFSQPTNSGKSLAQAFFGPENEWHLAYHYEPQSSSSKLDTTPSLDPAFTRSSATVAVAESQLHVRLPSASASRTPPSRTIAPDIKASLSLDQQLTSDPFIHDSDASDDELEHLEPSPEARAVTSSDRLSLSLVPSSQLLATSHSDGGRSTDIPSNLEQPGKPSEAMDIASSVASDQSSSPEETESDDATYGYQPYASTAETDRPVSLRPGIDPRALFVRSGNRDRVPPPPPKSHHGRLISPDSNITSPGLQMISSRSTNRASMHGSYPRTSLPPNVSQRVSDYTSASTDRPALSTDALRRSQSQHKRPPTPPLSRRHSQMRRSKSTLSKPSSSQLSSQQFMTEAATSTPSSSASHSLTPLELDKGSRSDPILLDEERSLSTSRTENVISTSPERTETPGSEIHSNPRVNPKQESLTNHLPPPPPPRRTRGRNQGSDINSLVEPHSEQRADEPENYVPRPSNANDILADLSRLQKEVDDLRGHYENRKAQ
ncbi:hypothetical protein BDV19DRAFT_376271 [Aspergillus venezuelensis]